MYSSREVFKYPPLMLVAAEIRYIHTPRLRREPTVAALADRLRSHFPILEDERQTVVKLFPEAAAAEEEVEILHRLYDEDRTASVTISSTSLSVETTHYTDFAAFKILIMEAVTAVGEIGSVSTLSRVGLRYINEIRIPEAVKDAHGWDGWISPSLSAPVSLAGDKYQAATNQGWIKYVIGEDQSLLFRYAALDGPGVVSDRPLRRRYKVEPTPYFVLDMDCSQQFDAEEAIDYDPGRISQVLDELHIPHGEVFQSSITDRLRNVFRGD